MKRFILMDQVMPLDGPNGETYYVVWGESPSREKLVEWAHSKGMAYIEYKIEEINPT